MPKTETFANYEPSPQSELEPEPNGTLLSRLSIVSLRKPSCTIRRLAVPGKTASPLACCYSIMSCVCISTVPFPSAPRFDSTLGYPGEGPGFKQLGKPPLQIASMNVTSWGSFTAAIRDHIDFHNVSILAVLEHKLCAPHCTAFPSTARPVRAFVSSHCHDKRRGLLRHKVFVVQTPPYPQPRCCFQWP
jgi:hypothetical protein